MNTTHTPIQIALGQMQVIPGQPLQNYNRAVQCITSALEQQANIIVLPELCLSGYLIGDIWEEESFIKDLEKLGNQLGALSTNCTLIFGNIGVDWENHGEDGRVRKMNAAWVFQNGQAIKNPTLPVHFFPKTLSPEYREFSESRHFFDLRKLATQHNVPTQSLLSVVPLQNPNVNIGIQLCEDAWDQDYNTPVSALQKANHAQILINLSSSPFTAGKNARRNILLSQRSTQLGIPIVYVNNTGIQNNGKTLYAFDGNSTVYFPWEQMPITVASPFAECCQTVAVPIPTIGDSFPQAQKLTTPDPVPDFSPELIQQILPALQYSCAQYLTQSSLSKVVIGVSGGIDSAVVCALFATLLPPENLLLVNMPSQHNSQTTIGLSRQIAQNIGCWYTEVSIEDSVQLTQRQMDCLIIHKSSQQSPTEQENLTLQFSDFHLENIQARDRSSRILAALAASFGGVFTCNANKSELMVGYSTLYGDHGGFLAPLADLWKTQVYQLGMELNKWFQAKVAHVVIPEKVFRIPPAAELSPTQNPEKGQGDPLLYWYHDRLFHSWQQRWNRWSPEEILRHYIQKDLPEVLQIPSSYMQKFWHIYSDPTVFIADLERWYKSFKGLGCIKRVQSPTLIAVSRRAFGFDYRESIMQPYFTTAYLALKESLVQGLLK
jgi:NAD+ synthase (glutamine-hydrolysing)